MIDYEFRVFSPKLIDLTIRNCKWLLSKNLLIKRNSRDFHVKIFKKNNKIFLCSIPFNNKKSTITNYNYLLDYKEKLKINNELILPLSLHKDVFNFQIKFILRKLKYIDGVEILCNHYQSISNKNLSKPLQIISAFKRIIKKKKNIKFYFFPQSVIKMHQSSFSLSFISNIILKINKFNKFRNSFFILMSGGGFDYYLDNGKFSKIFKNVNLIFDTHLNTPFKAGDLIKRLGKKRVKFGSDYPFIGKKNIFNIYKKHKKLF